MPEPPAIAEPLPRWEWLTRKISAFEQRWAIVRWIPWPRDYSVRVEAWVFARLVGLDACVWGAYPYSSSSWFVIVPAVITFADYLLVVTANAFKPIYPLHNRFRYVVLNLIGFVTLVAWFAIFLAPWGGHFFQINSSGTAVRVPLNERTALNTAWAAITASAVIPGNQHTGIGAALVLAAATMTSLYLLVVILVIAVNRATDDD